MSEDKILIFAGTTEGRKLIEKVSMGESRLNFYVSVATEYGKSLYPENLSNVVVLSGRLTSDEMVDLMKKHQFHLVIDATHPYAVDVTKNIKEACNKSNTKYIRLLRELHRGAETHITEKDLLNVQSRCVYVKDTQEAIDYLNETEGKVLLTTGSKELEAYTKIKNYKERLFPRVLPTTEVVEKCWNLGFSAKQLICIQGPFSYEMNLAMIRQIDASYLVTKETGDVGGFYEKCEAAMEAGANLVIIQKEQEKDGFTLKEVLDIFKQEYDFNITEDKNFIDTMGNWFPMFINFINKKILVVGAGKIASRRIQTLMQFNCRLKVVAKMANSNVVQANECGKLELLLKEYEELDLEGIDVVIAATDDRVVNHKIYENCKKHGIMVNIADCKEECDFYFPGVIRLGNITVGVTAEGKDHSMAKEVTGKIRKSLEESMNIGMGGMKNGKEKG